VATPLTNYKIIGKGAFGLVYKGQKTCTGTDKEAADNYVQDIAVKYIVLNKIVNKRFPVFPRYGRVWRVSSPEKVRNEISILNKLTRVEGVVQLYNSEHLVEDEIREDGNGNSITLFPGYYLYLEYCNGGELLDYILSRGWISRMVSLPETTVQVIILKLVQIMKECHALGVTHRDLKPENILLNLNNSPPEKNLWKDCLRINDFGLASTDTDMCYFCGTPGYQSPENAHGLEYTEKTDVWSIGVITYVMLTGKFPFPVGMWNTRPSSSYYDLDLTKLRTTESEEFLKRIFTLESDRPSMDTLLKSKWLSGLERLSDTTYIEDLVSQSGGSSTYEDIGRVYKLRKFVARERVRKIQEGLLTHV
jgi:serine/threonine protein kinase